MEFNGVLPRWQGDERSGVGMDLQARFVRFLSIGHHKRVFCIVPRNGCVQEISAGDGDVLKPQQHVKVECPPFLKFKLVEIALDVGRGGMVLVAEDMRSPAIAVSAREVSTCNLLQNVCNMQRLQGSYFGHFSAIPVPQLLDKRRKRKGPLVRADGQEERGITVLPYGIYEV